MLLSRSGQRDCPFLALGWDDGVGVGGDDAILLQDPDYRVFCFLTFSLFPNSRRM